MARKRAEIRTVSSWEGFCAMGIAELIVAICLQAVPRACRITRDHIVGGLTSCVVREEPQAPAPGWYLARSTCRWRQ